MRRRVVLIIVFLILGAVVNVAVAWGLAARGFPERTNYFGGITRAGDEWNLIRNYKSMGWRRTYSVRFYPPDDWDAPINPSEISAIKQFPRNTMFHNSRLFCDRTGWPILAVTLCGTVTDGEPFHMPRTEIVQIDGGLLLRPKPQPSSKTLYMRDHRLELAALPLVPIWPGFIINTIFYALLLWLLFIGPFAIRRALRRKRRLCEKCAYPIGVSPVCTECGAALPPKVGATASDRRESAVCDAGPSSM